MRSIESDIASKRKYKTIVAEFRHDFPLIADLVLQTSIKKKDAARLNSILQQIQPVSLLEIGSYCGISTKWIALLLPNATITCVDPWVSDGTVNSEFVFNHMTEAVRDRIIKKKAYFGGRNNQAFSVPNSSIEISTTKPGLYDKSVPIYRPEQKFDVIFADGDHRITSSIATFMLAKEYTDCFVYHDANMKSHTYALNTIKDEWRGEWEVEFFPDGEDGLAVIYRPQGVNL